MSVLHIGYILFILFAKVSNVLCKDKLIQWNEEIDRSLKSNLQDLTCPVSFVPSTVSFLDPRKLTFVNDSILVRRLYPTERELFFSASAPESLSAVDANVPEFAAKRRYSYEEWGNEKMLRWEIPDNHPGQNRNNCISMTKLAAEGLPVSFYQEFREIDRIPYLIYLRHGFVHPTGSVATPCGYFQGQEGCETRWNRGKEWYRQCGKAIVEYTSTKQSTSNDDSSSNNDKADWTIFAKLLLSASQSTTPNSISESEKSLWGKCMTFTEQDTPYGGQLRPYVANETRPMFVDTVVVIPALWDFNYHHFVADSLVRIVSILPLLRRRQDIFIHIRSAEIYDAMYYADKEFVASAIKMRTRLFNLLGIEATRIIWGPVVANTVIVPRPTRCSYAISNPIELLRFRQVIIGTVMKKLRDDHEKTNSLAVWKQTLNNFLYLTQSVLAPSYVKSMATMLTASVAKKEGNDVILTKEGSRVVVPTITANQPTQENNNQKLKQQHASKKHSKPQVVTKFERRSKREKKEKPLLPERRLTPANTAVHLLQDVLPSEKSLHYLGEKEEELVAAQSSTNEIVEESSSKSAEFTPPVKKTLLLLQRHTDFASSDRNWSDKTTKRLKIALQFSFPDHEIIIVSSKPQKASNRDSPATPCWYCDFVHYFTADIVVAAHGAGLTNLLLVPPHTVVIEIAGEVKDVNLPVCGYYSPLSSIVGAHHFLYVHDMEPPFGKLQKLDSQNDKVVKSPEEMEENQLPAGEQESRSNNPDYAMPAYDIARKARLFYDSIRRHRSYLKENKNTATPQVRSVADILKLDPSSSISSSSHNDQTKNNILSPTNSVSVIYRPEVIPRISMVNYPKGLLFVRVNNSTQGPIMARP